jgi:hypothetical protein
MAYKVFSNGDALTGSELNTYLMNQSVMVFASTTARDAALTAPTEGMVVWLQDANKYVYYTGSAWSDLITPASSGNAIINGAFDIWQRGTSFTYTTVFNYTADRWLIICNGTGAYTASQQTFTPGTAPVAGYEGKNFLRLAVTSMSGASATGIFQRIEDVRTYAGQTVTLSFWAKADAARTVTPQLAQIFGTGGSSAVTTTGTGVSLTTSWVRYTQTFTVPSVSGKTITSDSNLELGLMVPLNTVETIDVWGVQLEAGSTATAFERNASNIQGELAACQRYYFLADGTSSYFLAQGQCTSSSAGQVQCIFPVPMRTAPSLTVLGTLSTNFIVINSSGGSAGAPTSITLGAAATNKARVDFSGVSGLTAGHATTLQNGNSGTGLSWSAEL